MSGQTDLLSNKHRPLTNACLRAICLITLIIPAFFGFAAMGAEPAAQPARLRLDLNGVWQFRLDPKDEGALQKWFSSDAKYTTQINVPGCWQAQGFGPAEGHLRHNYRNRSRVSNGGHMLCQYHFKIAHFVC